MTLQLPFTDTGYKQTMASLRFSFHRVSDGFTRTARSYDIQFTF